MSNITQILNWISSSLLLPVTVLLLIGLACALVSLGGFFADSFILLKERKLRRKIMGALRKGEPVDFETLKQFGLKECFKFKQESVYIQAPGQPPVYLDSDGNRVDKSSSLDFKLNRDGEEFFTTTSRDKTHPQRFTGDIQFESVCIPLRPGDYNERMRRLKQGEYIL